MCFSMAYLENLFIWFIVIFASFALIKLLVSALTSVAFWPLLPWPPITAAPVGFVQFVVAAVHIVLWALIGIVMVLFIFGLISCLWSFTGGLGSILPHR